MLFQAITGPHHCGFMMESLLASKSGRHRVLSGNLFRCFEWMVRYEPGVRPKGMGAEATIPKSAIGYCEVAIR